MIGMKYVMQRIVGIIPLLVAISFFSFSLIHLAPSDPAEVALRVNDIVPTEEAIESMREELGLDEPFLVRYFAWLRDCLRGDFGTSFITKKPVFDEIVQALPPTLYLAGVAFFMIVIISITLAVICVIFEERFLDRALRTFVFVAEAMPSYWFGLLLIWFFSVKLDLFPTSGFERPSSVVLPALTLSFAYIPTYVRLLRGKMIEHKGENYVLYARARGLKGTTIYYYLIKHSFHSSLTALGMSIPKLVAGTVVIENIFAWPGIGRLCVDAIFHYDYPIIQAYVLLIAVLFVVLNLLVDIVTTVLDPRWGKEG